MNFARNVVRLLKQSASTSSPVGKKSSSIVNGISATKSTGGRNSADLAFAPGCRWKSSTAVLASSSDTLLSLPPNLIFHKNVTCSPYYGLSKVPTEKEAATKEKKEEELYDLSTLPTKLQPNLAQPLPQRLYVQVYSFPPDNSLSNTNDTVGTLYLNETVFGRTPIRTDLIHRVVVYQRNKKRGLRNAGARTKTISEVSGSGKKMRPQKGSGKARCGHKRPPHWRGGAKAHGPKGAVQDYTTKLNKKVRKLGLCHALSQKLYEGNLIVVNDLKLPTFKTKHLASALVPFEIGGRNGTTALLIDHQEDTAAAATKQTVSNEDEQDEDVNLVLTGVNANVKVASRNLHQIKLLNQLGANVYDIIKYEKLMISLSALKKLEERLKSWKKKLIIL